MYCDYSNPQQKRNKDIAIQLINNPIRLISWNDNFKKQTRLHLSETIRVSADTGQTGACQGPAPTTVELAPARAISLVSLT